MTTNNNARPTMGTSAEENRLTACSQDTSSTLDTLDRCQRCGRPLRLPRSLACGYGRRCWARTDPASLDRGRDAVGRLLARVARRSVTLEAGGLAIVTAALSAALDAERVEGPKAAGRQGARKDLHPTTSSSFDEEVARKSRTNTDAEHAARVEATTARLRAVLASLDRSGVTA